MSSALAGGFFTTSTTWKAPMQMHTAHERDFPGSPVAKTLLSLQGAWVRSLVRELRAHKLHGQKNTKKQKIQ